ncbi:two-component regulator propeller domain-containing protein [Anatilimnocola sp. NA78]|uniref:sensor histidine kinase n=1 Tax=Anatilimnocola sp. NA78 TaxID=3415683 RepID=UPI003CE505D8
MVCARRSSIACLIAAALLLCLPCAARALDPQRPLTQALLRIWQANQGLPRASIFSLHQTRNGYLWLGTQAGLYRFDGARFVPIEGSGRVANHWIQDLCEDDTGTLWIATDDAGLIGLQDGATFSLTIAEGLPSNNIQCLLVDHRGQLWVGTDQGLAFYRQGKFQVYQAEQGLPTNAIRAISETPTGKILIGTAGPHVCSWDGSKFVRENFSLLPPQSTIQALQATDDDTVWIGTSAGLLRRRGNDDRLFTTVDGLGDNLVHCLTLGSSGGLWVGTKDGLCRILGDRVEPFQTKEGLSQSTVFAICEDHEGSLWVGTKNGLNQLVDRRTLLPFTTTEGLPSNATGPVLQSDAGNIWVGTLGAGLAQFDGRRFTQVATTNNGLLSDTVLSLADSDGDLWIGTELGLCKFQAGKVVERYTKEDGLPANKILSLCRDRAGALWVGTEAGLVELREGKFVAPQGEEAVVAAPIQSLIDVGGKYLVAALAGGGLYRVQDGRISLLNEQLSGWSDIHSLYLDEQNRLWAAIRGGGLGLIDGDRQVRFSVKDGLYDDDIFGIATDDKGRLWMACSRGIFFVPLADLEKFAAGQSDRLISTPFSPTDALRTIECQSGVQPTVWKMQDGRVWFSTIRGIIVVDPQRFGRQLPKPSVLIEEVRVNGQDMRPQQLQRLPPGHTNFEFHYTALSFASPTRIAFRYQLEGFDPNWIASGSRRQAFYTNLAPGRYRFRVQAINSDGSETEAALPVEFTLRPHFYETSSFLLLLLAGIAAAAWIAYRLRVRHIKDRLQVVLTERNRIARELHDTLIQGFSGVTMQMQALATRLQKSPESATLTEIIRDAGGCLSEARRSVAGLRNPQGSESGLATAIAQTARQLTEASDARLSLQLATLASKLDADLEYNVLRIVQEAIANAVRHAGASLIEVKMGVERQRLVISIHDDGSGFDVQRHLEQVQPGHYGIIGMRERASQIGAQLQWRSHARQGTTVTLSLPVAASLVAIPERSNP